MLSKVNLNLCGKCCYVCNKLTDEQAEIYQFARNGKNILVTGQAGTGKLIDCRKRLSKRLQTTRTTGRSCLLKWKWNSLPGVRARCSFDGSFLLWPRCCRHDIRLAYLEINRWLCQWLNERTNERTGEQASGRTDGRPTEKWMNKMFGKKRRSSFRYYLKFWVKVNCFSFVLYLSDSYFGPSDLHEFEYQIEYKYEFLISNQSPPLNPHSSLLLTSRSGDCTRLMSLVII